MQRVSQIWASFTLLIRKAGLVVHMLKPILSTASKMTLDIQQDWLWTSFMTAARLMLYAT
jgi:hypothetical protein